MVGAIMVFSVPLLSLLTRQIAFTLFAALQLLGTLIILFVMKVTKGLPLGQSPFITKKAADISDTILV